MTNKQIIIDGVNVAECVYRAEEKCILKDDECCFFPNCHYKNWQRKEQECEKLKLDLIEAKAHKDYLNNLALSETLNLVSEKLDQLKAENEILEKDKANLDVIKETLKVQFKQLKQNLEEIKEIVKQGVKIHDDIIVSKQILQKIKECEGNNDNICD